MKKILKSKFKMYKITKKKKKNNHWEYDVWQGGQEGVELGNYGQKKPIHHEGVQLSNASIKMAT